MKTILVSYNIFDQRGNMVSNGCLTSIVPHDLKSDMFHYYYISVIKEAFLSKGNDINFDIDECKIHIISISDIGKSDQPLTNNEFKLGKTIWTVNKFIENFTSEIEDENEADEIHLLLKASNLKKHGDDLWVTNNCIDYHGWVKIYNYLKGCTMKDDFSLALPDFKRFQRHLTMHKGFE